MDCLSEKTKQFQKNNKDLDNFFKARSARLVAMSDTEEKSLKYYCLWQHEREINLDNPAVSAIICHI